MSNQNISDDQSSASISNRGAWTVLVIGAAGFFYWATTTPLAEAVPASGTVVIEGNRKVVQHMYGGMVTQLNVKDGQRVSAGDLLLQIDPLTASANLSAVQQEIESITKSLGMQKSVLKRLDRIKELKTQQLVRAQSELTKVVTLVEKGFATETEKIKRESEILEYQRDIQETEISQAKTTQSLREQTNQLITLRQKLNALDRDLALTNIHAPVSGQVQQLTVHTKGQVIQPAEVLMELVPVNESVSIDVRIPPLSIDRVQEGQKVDLRFPNFASQPQLTLQATMTTISGDVIQDNDRSAPYYKGRAELDKSNLSALAGIELKPGMSVEVTIQVGERTVFEYLLHPLTRRFARMMTEQ